MITPKGLGAFPDQPCYDPDRPWWLPNELDTLGEEECRLTGTWNTFTQGSMNPKPPSTGSQNPITKNLTELAPYLLIGALGMLLFKKVL